MAKYLLKIPGIMCNHCKLRISRALEELGERKFEVSIEDKEVIIETENLDQVKRKLDEIGYMVEEIVSL